MTCVRTIDFSLMGSCVSVHPRPPPSYLPLLLYSDWVVSNVLYSNARLFLGPIRSAVEPIEVFFPLLYFLVLKSSFGFSLHLLFLCRLPILCYVCLQLLSEVFL